MEAEYVSLTEAAKEFIWLKNVIDNKSLNLELSENVMFCDNQAAISFSKSPVENYRTKHIDVRYHFLRHLIYDKDEVEKIAYQLNEEAERTERPIRRLSKVMYGSTCADMQVDVMGECLSSIKACCRCKISISGKEVARRIAVKITPSCCLSEIWRIINPLDDIWMLLPEVESWGKLEEGRSVTSVAAEFGIVHSIVSRLWRQFQTTGTAIRGVQ
ncbi:retrovirus-related Pol polyprotein from transposon TNT 1-94 [Trichonephila clavipes]|nr:retrovirus-related Pol polyprotein from transposon TNT 1-94 [Trichonephila clavipes]